MGTDRFGNTLAPGLPYARGKILASTEDDFRKLQEAWRIIEQRIRKHGVDAVFNFSGLERGLRIDPSDLALADDELAPAVYARRVTELALEHLGGTLDRHDTMLFNRLTAATFAVHLALVKPGDTVIGVSATYSHPTVTRAAGAVGAKFVDTVGVEAFGRALDLEKRVTLIVMTRLAVSYDALSLDALNRIVALSRDKGIRVYVDDAGGARVGPAIFDQPRMLELGVDLGATGLDKYGTIGPRLGLLAGERELVGIVRARAFEFGLEARPMLYPAVLKSLEQYHPSRVKTLVDCTMEVAAALKAILGNRVHETPVTAQLSGEDILEAALERAHLGEARIVPYEAMAALAMILLRDHGVLTVHFAGMPPGTPAILFKFVPPETLKRFGGAARFADAVEASLNTLSTIVGSPEAVRQVLLGNG